MGVGTAGGLWRQSCPGWAPGKAEMWGSWGGWRETQRETDSMRQSRWPGEGHREPSVPRPTSVVEYVLGPKTPYMCPNQTPFSWTRLFLKYKSQRDKSFKPIVIHSIEIKPQQETRLNPKSYCKRHHAAESICMTGPASEKIKLHCDEVRWG